MVDAEPLRHSRAETLHEHIELRHQAQEQCAARLAGEVDCHALLVGVPGAEGRGVGFAAGPGRAAGPVAAAGLFNLDDIGAQPSQCLRAGGTGLELRQVEDLHAVQCSHDTPSAPPPGWSQRPGRPMIMTA